MHTTLCHYSINKNYNLTKMLCRKILLELATIDIRQEPPIFSIERGCNIVVYSIMSAEVMAFLICSFHG